jgi:hypothetical protein
MHEFLSALSCCACEDKAAANPVTVSAPAPAPVHAPALPALPVRGDVAPSSCSLVVTVLAIDTRGRGPSGRFTSFDAAADAFVVVAAADAFVAAVVAAVVAVVAVAADADAATLAGSTVLAAKNAGKEANGKPLAPGPTRRGALGTAPSPDSCADCCCCRVSSELLDF